MFQFFKLKTWFSVRLSLAILCLYTVAIIIVTAQLSDDNGYLTPVKSWLIENYGYTHILVATSLVVTALALVKILSFGEKKEQLFEWMINNFIISQLIFILAFVVGLRQGVVGQGIYNLLVTTLGAAVLYILLLASLTVPFLISCHQVTLDFLGSVFSRTRKLFETTKVTPAPPQPKITATAEVVTPKSEDFNQVIDGFKMPSLELLAMPKKVTSVVNHDAIVAQIENIFTSRGLEVWVSDRNIGPTIAQYILDFDSSMLRPEDVTKYQKLLETTFGSTVRIATRLENYPGKIGIEVPNKIKTPVSLRTLLDTQDFRDRKENLPIALGVAVDGTDAFITLAKTPHLVVGGTTGSGKSVGLNTMLMSLLYKYTPRELQLILIDMKQVEFSIYSKIPHLLVPTISDEKKATKILKYLVAEMERRYSLLNEQGKRNIQSYNESASKKKYDKLPYIVVAIDELADLMMTAKSQLEPIIAKLAQKSRACGIHLILATQRPDKNVVTGLIKANIPSRIAYQVASGNDSQIILDFWGAEKLLGQGDALIVSPATQEPLRFQSAFVSETEVEKVCEFLATQSEFSNLNDSLLSEPNVVTDQTATAVIAETSSDSMIDTVKRYILALQSEGKNPVARDNIGSKMRKDDLSYSNARHHEYMEELETSGFLVRDEQGKLKLAAVQL
jgi:DNA segregation ATPase FtsK/SpoIIIE-like protein